MELCHCGAIFNNTRAGDKHRVIDYKYAVVRLPDGITMKVRHSRLDAIGYDVKVLSRNNEARRCLSSDEMRGIGMRMEANGAWNSGGIWIGSNERSSA